MVIGCFFFILVLFENKLFIGVKKHMMDRFRRIVNSEKPVLVDFYAGWFIPFKILARILKYI